MQNPVVQFPQSHQIPDAVTVNTSSIEMRYLIDGKVLTWRGDGIEARSPVCVQLSDSLKRVVIGKLPRLDESEALRALKAAHLAWDDGRGIWPTMRVARRINCVERLIDAMLKVREQVVRLLMWEIAKTRKDAESEFDRTITYMRDTVDALKDLDRGAGRFSMEEGTIGQIRRSPLGVVLCMGPFNYPLNETFTTMIPALIMGNTVVVKLPRFGGLSQLPLLEPMAELFPKGVINVIQGDGRTIVGPMMETGLVDSLAFIGTSTAINAIRRRHPRPNRLRCITGLEAKNPAIVLPDADIDIAVTECLSGSLSFNGQRCTAIKMVFVHESIASDFVSKLSSSVDSLVAGMPWEEGVRITPLPEEGKPGILEKMVDDARSKGAKIVNGGGQTLGTFYKPAVVFPVSPESELFHVEQFGPVVPITTFSKDDELDNFMRHSPYGQQVALFGKDPKRLAQLIDVMINQVSRININSQCRRGPDTFPFTGRKDSAEGTLSVHDALRAFSIRTLVATSSNDMNKHIVHDIVTGRLSSFLTTDYIF